MSTRSRRRKPLNCFIVETPELALKQAAASDAALAKGEARPLEGIPLAIKDLYCTDGVQTTAGSHILEGFVPPYESTVSANLWRDGAVMLGKLNLDEFAMGSSNETSYFGPVVSPWRRAGDEAAKLVPGGSSGGSAAAGGGTAVLRRHGDRHRRLDPPARSLHRDGGHQADLRALLALGHRRFRLLARPGPARSPATCATAPILMRAMAGHDPKDTTSVDLPVPDYEAAVGQSIKGRTIGIPREYRMDGMAPEISALWDQGIAWLRDAGADIREITLPHTRYALAAYYIVAPAEASSNLARYDGVRYGLREPGRDITDMYEATRAAGFGKEVRRRIMIGTYVLSAGYYDAYYLRAQKIRTLIKRDFEDAFAAGVDAILTPATPSAAFAQGEKGSGDPIEMYLNDVFTVTVNMAGLPGIAVPAGSSANGLPLGLQLIGRAFDEETLFAVAAAIETGGAQGRAAGALVVGGWRSASSSPPARCTSGWARPGCWPRLRSR